MQKNETTAVESIELQLLKRVERPDILLSIARDAQTNRIFCGSSDAKVYELDLEADQPQRRALAGHRSYVTGVVLAGENLITGSYDRQLIWWDREKDEPRRAVKAHDKWIRRVAASPDGKIVASVADDMICRLWNADSGQLIHELVGHKRTNPHQFPSMLYTCAFSPEGRFLATADKVGHVCVWDVEFGEEVLSLESPENYTWDPTQRRHTIGGVRSLAFSPDGKLLAVGGIGRIGNIDHLDGKALVQVYDWRRGERIFKLEHDQQKGLVEQLWFYPDGKWLLGAGGADKGFMLFMDVASGKFVHDQAAPMHIHAIEPNWQANTIYTVGHRSIVIWKVRVPT